LRKNSVGEGATAGDVQTQQVLDNLAMFVCNPSAMPYFSYPNTGSASVTDAGSATAAPSFASTVSGILTLSLSRQAMDSFTLTPVNDPRRLELMRCAYQKAVAGYCGREPSTTCPDCQTRFRMFYTGNPNGDIRANANGAVTSECLRPDLCWFHVGCEKCAHKCGKCNLIGHYCGVYVWVGPEGRDELTKLTLAILDYATGAPPAKRQKEVVYNLDVYGLPTVSDKSVAKVTATIAIDEHNESLLTISQADATRIEEQLDYRLKTVRNRLAATQDAEERKALREEEETLMGKLDFLHERLRAGGLKEQYYPQSPIPAGTGILGLQQQLNAVTPTAPPHP
jgi:hypothetical protein